MVCVVQFSKNILLSNSSLKVLLALSAHNFNALLTFINIITIIMVSKNFRRYFHYEIQTLLIIPNGGCHNAVHDIPWYSICVCRPIHDGICAGWKTCLGRKPRYGKLPLQLCEACLVILIYTDTGITGEVITAHALMSDCQPIPYNGEVVWYVVDSYINPDGPIFYRIDANGVLNSVPIH